MTLVTPDNMRQEAGLGREVAGVEVVSADAFSQRQRGSLRDIGQRLYFKYAQRNSLVSAVTVDPTAAATSFASNGSMRAEHQRQKEGWPIF